MPEEPAVDVADIPPGAVLLDVREDDEWAAGHAPDAVHLVLATVPVRLAEIPPGDLYVICRSGARSAQAVAWLNRNGHPATNVTGGMQQWQRDGRAMVSENGAPPAVV